MSATLQQTQPNLDMKFLNRWFDQRLEQKLSEKEAEHIPTMTLVTTKGTLDMAYPPFILASTAAALGWQVEIFFTFYALSLLKKKLNLDISPLGNPAMPMKLPIGPQWLRNREMVLPNLLMSNIPGFEKMATGMMKKTMQQKGISSIEELRALCIEADVKLVGCQMTADLFAWDKEEFIPDVTDWVGATSMLPRAQQSDVNYFI